MGCHRIGARDGDRPDPPDRLSGAATDMKAEQALLKAVNEITNSITINLDERDPLDLMALAAVIGIFGVDQCVEREKAKKILHGLIDVAYDLEAFRDEKDDRH
jgi:hypothetical protein